MALFDGGRWDRARRAGFTWRWREGRRVEPSVELNVYSIPLPRLWCSFEQCTVSVAVSLATPAGDPVVSAGVEVELPGRLADGLVLVWPGIERRDRRDALRRMVGRPR